MGHRSPETRSSVREWPPHISALFLAAQPSPSSCVSPHQERCGAPLHKKGCSLQVKNSLGLLSLCTEQQSFRNQAWEFYFQGCHFSWHLPLQFTDTLAQQHLLP